MSPYTSGASIHTSLVLESARVDRLDASTSSRRDQLMLAIIAAVLFFIGFVVQVTGTDTAAIFTPTSLLLAGLVLLALHLAGFGKAWRTWRR